MVNRAKLLSSVVHMAFEDDEGAVPAMSYKPGPHAAVTPCQCACGRSFETAKGLSSHRAHRGRSIFWSQRQ